MNPFEEGSEEYGYWQASQQPDVEYTPFGVRHQTGGSFIFDQPDTPPCIWGFDRKIGWAQGESLMIVGSPGVGKTTLAIQIVAARLGIRDWNVLGLPVLAGRAKVLYLAMDRPPQIARAMARVFEPSERQALDSQLVVWKGPPPADVSKDATILAQMATQAGADTLIVDSIKDAFTKVSDDEAGANYNRARQYALVHGIEILELHHNRKQGQEHRNQQPTLDDVYGSRWLTAGAGSVMLLNGQPGDPLVEFVHVKQPLEELGPWKIIHDHEAGYSSIDGEVDLPKLAGNQGAIGLTINIAAQQIFQNGDPTRVQLIKAERRLMSLVRAKILVRQTGQKGGPDRFFRAARDEDHVSY